MLGPYTSASSSPVLAPLAASASARFAETVDLPTPPLPEATGMTLRTPSIEPLPEAAAGFALAELVSSAETLAEGSADCTAPSASDSTACASARSDTALWSLKLTDPPFTAKSWTRPSSTMLRP